MGVSLSSDPTPEYRNSRRGIKAYIRGNLAGTLQTRSATSNYTLPSIDITIGSASLSNVASIGMNYKMILNGFPMLLSMEDKQLLMLQLPCILLRSL